MADSPFKGLLYSPEVLGGIGLLTQGLSGESPGVALPSMMQGMKTASMFSAMEKEYFQLRQPMDHHTAVPGQNIPCSPLIIIFSQWRLSAS